MSETREQPITELENEVSELAWRDGRMMFTFEAGEGENELPTDIDIDTVFLDYYSGADSKVLGNETPKTRETVLVLPGIGMDLEVNRPFLEELAKSGHKVISLSVPGCGESGDPSKEWRRQTIIKEGEDGEQKLEQTKEWKHDFSDYSALLNRLLGKLREQGKIGEDEKVRVIGHSLGGSMGAEFAANNSDQVSALDLIAPGGYRKVEPNSAHLYLGTTVDFIHKQVKEVVKRIIKNGQKELPDIIRRMWLNNFSKKDRKFDWANLDEEGAGVLPRAMQRLWETEVVLQANLVKDMEKASTTMPTRVFSGKDDGLFPWHEYEEIISQLQAGGGQVELKVVPGAGHYGPVMNSGAVVKALQEQS